MLPAKSSTGERKVALHQHINNLLGDFIRSQYFMVGKESLDQFRGLWARKR